MRKTKQPLKFQKFTTPFYQHIALLAIPLSLGLILRFFGFDGLYGQDAYEYLRYTKAIQEYLLGGNHPGTFFWPILYPFLAAILGFGFANAAIGLQVLSSLSIAVFAIYLLKTIRLVYPKLAYPFLYVLIFGLCCPFLFKMSFIAMSDATAIMWIAITVYYFFASNKMQTALVPVFVFATCAVMTRYAALVIVFPIIVFNLYLIMQRKAIKQLTTAIIGSGIVMIPFLLLQWNALFEATSNYFLQSWSPSYFISSSYTTQDGFQAYPFPNGLYVCYVIFHPGFIFLGIPLLFLTLKNYKSSFEFPEKLLAVCIGIYLIFLAGIQFQNPRILALVFPLVLLLLYPAFHTLVKVPWIKKYAFPFAGIALILQLAFWSKTFAPIFLRTLHDQEMVAMVAEYQGKTLYSFDVDLALQGRGMQFDYKNLYVARYTNLNTKDLVLFHPKRFQQQWEGKNPMLNWNYINQNYVLNVLEAHKSGWKLYEIESKK